MSGGDRQDRGRATHGVHDPLHDASVGAPVVPPLAQSATYHWATPEDGELLYSRYGNNPNQLAVGRKVAALEGTEAAVVLGSGMGAMAMAILAHAKSGDHVIASSQLYGATQTLLRDELPHRGFETTFVDPDGGDFGAAIRTETKLVVIEMPTNPTLRLLDPRPIVEAAHERGVPVLCDETFASPINLRLAEHGVDIVMHSATKYLAGHSDVIAGAIAGSAEVVAEVTRLSRLYGPALDPHAAWLIDRGLRTLDVRMQRHNENAMAVATALEEHDAVARVLYPGLPSHPDHALASELMDGFGGMVSIVLAGGGEAADRFMGRLELAHAAPSLGGVETLVSQPRYTSHAGLTDAQRDAMGIPDGFVRLSIGVEDAADLIADFGQALS